MPIKKSSLEQKWYYRAAKVFLVVAPLLIALILLFLGRGINICGVAQKDLAYFIYILAGWVFYLLILKAVWRLFLYVVFGGLEEDAKNQDVREMAQNASPVRDKFNVLILLVIGVGVIIAVLYGLNNHKYGAACAGGDGKTGIYGTNGHCYTCPAGTAASTSSIENKCSGATAGVYCCRVAGENSKSEETENKKDEFGGLCHTTSVEWGHPCGKVEGGVAVSGLPIPDYCDCPRDTAYSGVTDVITPGGPWKICTCNK